MLIEILEKKYEQIIIDLKKIFTENTQRSIFLKHYNKKQKIYCLIDPLLFEIKYIGRTKQLLNVRFRDHLLGKNLLKNTPKNNWIKKLKKESLEPFIEVIEYCNIENVEAREIFWIEYFKSIGVKLKNSTGGGADGGIFLSDEVKEKMSLFRKGKKFSDKHKENISKALKGKKKINPRKGYTHSDSTRQKISEKAKGCKYSDEAKQKMKGRISWNKGKKIYKEGKPVLYFSPIGELIKEYDSIKTVESETNISRWKIYASINNKVKKPYPFGYFKFKY